MLNYRKHINDQVGDGVFMRDPSILPPNARKLLQQIGNEPISSIEIVRTPLSSFTRGFLNAISLGQFDKISKKSYDQIFHLSLWINGKYNLEKNAVIAFNQKNPKEAKSEVKNVSNIPQGLTFQTLIDKTKARMGDKFGPYDAETNNCQSFLMNIFQANGLGDQSDLNFIKQDTKEIFQQLPEFSKVLGKTATNLGAIFDRLLQGEGQIGGMDDIEEEDEDIREVGALTEDYIPEVDDLRLGGIEDDINGIYDHDEIPEFLTTLDRIERGMEYALTNRYITDRAETYFRRRIKKVQKLRRKLLAIVAKDKEDEDKEPEDKEREDYDSDEGKERVILGEDFELPSRIRDRDDDDGARETKEDGARETKGGCMCGGTIAHRNYLKSLKI